MRYVIVDGGKSRSFSSGDAFLTRAVATLEAEIVVYLRGTEFHRDHTKLCILVELDGECLGEHTGEAMGDEGSNVLGFARYRNGDDEPSKLIELVRQPATSEASLAVAKELFEAAGLSVAVCADQAGRIIDRLVRPKYNAALRLLDEGLGSQKDIDLTCSLGLGYLDGPIERTVRGGLAHHYDITLQLFEVYGTPGYAPARRAMVAARRREAGQ